jgi:hypothetical protein
MSEDQLQAPCPHCGKPMTPAAFRLECSVCNHERVASVLIVSAPDAELAALRAYCLDAADRFVTVARQRDRAEQSLAALAQAARETAGYLSEGPVSAADRFMLAGRLRAALGE